MEKHGLRAFIASFCLSLLIIFFISNVLFSQKSAEDNVKIVPENNIALFLKHDAPRSLYSPSGEVKRISLNIVAPIVPQVSDIKEVAVIAKSEIVAEDDVERLEIPIAYSKKIIEKEKIVEDYADFIEKRAPVNLKTVKEEVAEVLVDKDILYSQDQGVKEMAFAEKINVPILQGRELLFDGIADVAEASSLDVKNANVTNIDYSAAKEVEAEPATVEVVKEETPWVSMGSSDEIVVLDEAKTWREASGIKHPKNKLFEQKKEEVPLPSKPVSKNLLIPIPEELSKEGVVRPEIMSKDTFEDEDALEDVSEDASEEGVEKSSDILKNIGSLFSKASLKVGEEIKEQVESVSKKVVDVRDVALRKVAAKNAILPTEMRLVFAPNRVEVSGKTLNWLGAFAQKTKEEGMSIEIRLDGSSSYQLQQKRLRFVYNILASKGVGPGKVKTVFADRDPNSFVIRVVKIVEKKDLTKDYYKYYQQR